MDTIEAAPDHVKDRQKPGGCERSSQTGIAPARIAKFSDGDCPGADRPRGLQDGPRTP